MIGESLCRKSDSFEWPADAKRYEFLGVIGKVTVTFGALKFRELLQKCIKRAV